MIQSARPTACLTAAVSNKLCPFTLSTHVYYRKKYSPFSSTANEAPLVLCYWVQLGSQGTAAADWLLAGCSQSSSGGKTQQLLAASRRLLLDIQRSYNLRGTTMDLQNNEYVNVT